VAKQLKASHFDTLLAVLGQKKALRKKIYIAILIAIW
jgi:hypothetical protein